MARVKGAKNKPKTTDQLEKDLLARYAAEGKTETLPKPKDPPKTKEPAPAKKAGKKLELTPAAKAAKEDQDTYTCGNCQGKLDGEVPTCPHCGAALTW
ncbi:hypothetical protein ES703_35385 [subsurface metagenome]